jgi:hypothetical protein
MAEYCSRRNGMSILEVKVDPLIDEDVSVAVLLSAE